MARGGLQTGGSLGGSKKPHQLDLIRNHKDKKLAFPKRGGEHPRKEGGEPMRRKGGAKCWQDGAEPGPPLRRGEVVHQVTKGEVAGRGEKEGRAGKSEREQLTRARDR